MTRSVLGKLAHEEIRESIRRCRTSKEIAAEVDRLKKLFNVHESRIYEVTKDIRPKRKTRSDKGRRSFDVETNSNAKLVYGWIDSYGISTAEAVNIARKNGIEVPVEFPTLDRYLREDGLGKKQRRNPSTPHVRFEAKRPGDIFQFDMSGLKTRWFDTKTRRIVMVTKLDVSENHPNTNPDRVKVWRFSLVDDFSRRTFIRYYAVDKANSTHVVDFLLRAFSVMGVPLVLYTDNDTIILGGRNKRATEILNQALRDRGGYEVMPHTAGNARATGKVERLHQTVEQEEKVLGIYLAERGELNMDVLNDRLAAGFMHKKNTSIHSTTGQIPMDRWQSTASVVRTLDYEMLRSAFMADEAVVRLYGDGTFKFKRQTYQLPMSSLYPFADWAAIHGKKITVVFHDAADYYTVIGDDLTEYDITKNIAAADVAGDWKSNAETRAQRIRKEVRAAAKADAKAKKNAGVFTHLPILDDVIVEAAQGAVETRDDGVLNFPKREVEVTGDDIARVAPGRTVAAHNPSVNFWEAVNRYGASFGSKAECKEFMDTLFATRDEECWLLQTEIETALERRQSVGTVRLLKAV